MFDLFNSFRKKTKVFCIGKGKTGTTSLEHLLIQSGYSVSPQAKAELLITNWYKRDFRSIANFCKYYNAFQDIPFSLPYLYQYLDQIYPGSKFILSIRSSPEDWYESLVRFHSKIVCNSERIPTAEDLKNFMYRYKGWIWETQSMVYGIDEKTLYNKDIYIEHYKRHNEEVIKYFQSMPESLLVLDLSDTYALEKLGEFLLINISELEMPHLNKSQ